jgi:hypothetical protein
MKLTDKQRRAMFARMNRGRVSPHSRYRAPVDWQETAVKTFGTTEDFRKVGWILPDKQRRAMWAKRCGKRLEGKWYPAQNRKIRLQRGDCGSFAVAVAETLGTDKQDYPYVASYENVGFSSECEPAHVAVKINGKLYDSKGHITKKELKERAFNEAFFEDKPNIVVGESDRRGIRETVDDELVAFMKKEIKKEGVSPRALKHYPELHKELEGLLKGGEYQPRNTERCYLETEVRKIIKAGRMFDVPKVRIFNSTKNTVMLPNRCFDNVSRICDNYQSYKCYEGFALGGAGDPNDKIWRPHSWAVDKKGVIVETTTPRKKYFGHVVNDPTTLSDDYMGRVQSETDDTGIEE